MLFGRKRAVMLVQRIASPADPNAIPLYPEADERSGPVEVWSHFIDQKIVRNVTRPTLTPVLPAPGAANGTAVIVIPGGGFRFIAMENEGWPIARWLADLGVAAFILKYRLVETPDAEEAFASMLMAMVTNASPGLDLKADAVLPIADASSAMQMVRDNASVWKLDPARVGMLGFSAGAVTALGVTLSQDRAVRPDFVAPIYGPMLALSPPDNAPPMFAAMAANDEFFGRQGFGLIESWKRSGSPVEFHMYEAGGHGFGSFTKGTTSDAWFGHLTSWLKARGLLSPAVS
jgi:acetyl esterase/lipase